MPPPATGGRGLAFFSLSDPIRGNIGQCRLSDKQKIRVVDLSIFSDEIIYAPFVHAGIV